ALGQGLPTEYPHPDWLGTSRLASDALNRSVTHDVAFAPFGEQYVSTSLFDSTFTGVAPHDKAPDLYDFAAREYHPTQGRWISPDPAGLAAVDITNPQTLNRYAYVRNNPLALIDPSGLYPACGPGVPLPCTDTSTAVAPGGSDSFLYQIYFAWYYGYGNRPNSGGGGPGTGGGPGGKGVGEQPSSPNNRCKQPTKVQGAVIPVQAATARFLNMTVLTGLGISGGAGFGKGLGLYGSGSVQIAVSPSGAAAYVITHALPAAITGAGSTYVWLTPSTKGAGFLGGSQFGLSNASDPSQLEGPGIDASASLAAGIGIGADASLSIGGGFPYQVNFTLGGGLGGRAGAGAATNTIVVPICHN
ncbi:MAG TPA: RHS repeat-associated core domain-containing protein, partial [Bryobacteraceae bacterium]|nr:RHS repeat-associated core domain-containing protein [Bryobacteraceae bacterium]